MPHRHPANIAQLDNASLGQRMADGMARGVGSWTFLIVQSIVIVAWIALNTVAQVHRFDPFPFILLNLGLSMQAAITGPALLISANRSADRDRLTLERTFGDTELLRSNLDANTALTREVHTLTSELHAWMQQQGASPHA